VTPRRGRALSPEESRLWAQIARAVRPLAGRASPQADPMPSPGAPAAELASAPAKRSSLAAPALAPLAPLERRTLRALSRGSRRVEGVLDLHGLRQDEAHAALHGFLRRSQAAGRAVVLVVTGKGGEARAPFDERGVLRRIVPHWLGSPELRRIVLGFEPALPHHGGGGALYVRLRRQRPG
jgi:DNA-nicking Smr family endonuclease